MKIAVMGYSGSGKSTLASFFCQKGRVTTFAFRSSKFCRQLAGERRCGVKRNRRAVPNSKKLGD